ncbi:MAG: ornithine carbamoyltransferase [Candidatus Methanomethylicia archaeon]|nr:ornithine carbamoyltransferase [Candidatus Methanomethylicia archaeon]MCX8169293.1 ornithine carbamoyltransferase [Candidatus Methanomethylicia archaeon]MDW7988924.1 ornithine carbamoyltransferase [Nitrososphaerota archaeon]
MSLKGRDFLTLQEFSSDELWQIIKLAKKFKEDYYTGERIKPLLKGKTLAMIFQKPSTRTRVSFEIAMRQLGGDALYLNWNELQLGRGESVADTARVLSRYTDGIMARVYRHRDLEEMASAATIPVINGLSDLYHPCQAISDMFTIYEKKGYLYGVKMAFIGDGSNNVCNSLIIASTKLGLDINIASPKDYFPRPEVLKFAEQNSVESKSTVKLYTSPEEAVRDVDFIYTDVWVSMGQEKEAEKRLKVFSSYQVNSRLLAYAPKALVMHCLPAHRGLEITDDVIDSDRSIVWDQAENRLHVQKAILALLL